MTTAAEYSSPAFALPGAVPPPDTAADQGVPWHYGDPHGEQRRLVDGTASVDQSHLAVLAVTGGDRLSWLHSLLSAQLEDVDPGSSATALALDPHGHVEHEIHLVDDGSTSWLILEPGSAPDLLSYLDRMRFMLDVEVRDATAERAAIWRPVSDPDPSFPTWLVPAEYDGRGSTPSGVDRGGGADKYVANRPALLPGSQVLVPREQLLAELGDDRAGSWALEALRTAAAVPRQGQETDHRTIPHEVGWIGPAVHLAKGCYRGQETIARVHNMGKPPRRLALLHLDGSEDLLPAHGDPVTLDGRVVGWVGSAARHYELGPIATAVVKRSVPPEAVLVVGGSIAASQELVVLP